jgi:hypothetical protein
LCCVLMFPALSMCTTEPAPGDRDDSELPDGSLHADAALGERDAEPARDGAPEDAGQLEDAADATNPEDASDDLPPAPVGSGASAQAVIDANGGVLALGAITLSVPVASLTGPTTLRITELAGAAPASLGHALTPLYQMEPAGLVFAEPVMVRFPKPEFAQLGLYVLWSVLGDDSRYEQANSEVIGDWVYVQTTHFSNWVALLPSEVPGEDAGVCGDGLITPIRLWNPEIQAYGWWQETCDEGPESIRQCPYGPLRACKKQACDPVTCSTPLRDQSRAGCGDGVLQAVAKDGSRQWYTLGHFITGGLWDGLAVGTSSFGDATHDFEICDPGQRPSVEPSQPCPYGVRDARQCAACTDCLHVEWRVPHYCGDGTLDADHEQCDDGNEVDEACAYGDASCNHCKADCSGKIAPRVCGNGVVDDPSEECDEDTGLDCPYGESSCQVCQACKLIAGNQAGVCGDGAANGPEECDGLDVGGNDCETMGFALGELTCVEDCSFDTSACLVTHPQISAGYDFSCAVRGDGRVACWGNNDAGQCEVPSGSFRQVAAGQRHACALNVDGKPVCWGINGTAAQGVPNEVFTSIAAGYDISCGLRENGTIRCWGSEGLPYALDSTPEMGEFIKVTAFSKLGSNQYDDGAVCGLTSDHLAKCWNRYTGAFTAGTPALDIGSMNQQGITLPISGELPVWGSLTPLKLTSISGHQQMTCGLTPERDLACLQSSATQYADTVKTQPGPFVSVSTGVSHVCGVREGGALACFPKNYFDNLRPVRIARNHFVSLTAAQEGRYDPALLCGLTKQGQIDCITGDYNFVDSIPAGQFIDFSVANYGTGDPYFCAVRSDHSLICWGGVGYPWDPPPSGSFQRAVAGRYRSYALRDDGTIACWGTEPTACSAPYAPPAGTFSELAGGNSAYCAIRTDQTLACWGSANNVPTDAGYVQVVMESGSGCARKGDGTVTCFGPAVSASNWPAHPAGTYRDLSATEGMVMALRSDGSVTTWDYADLTEAGKLLPAAQGPFVDVAVNRAFACALRESGAVSCWGRDYASLP